MNRILALVAMLFAVLLVGCGGETFPTADDYAALRTIAAREERGFGVVSIRYLHENRVAVTRGIVEVHGDGQALTLVEECVFSVRPPKRVADCNPLWPEK